MRLTTKIRKKQIFIAMIASILAIITVIAIIKMSDSPAPPIIAGDYESYRNRAEYYFDTKKYREAERDYLHAIKILKQLDSKNPQDKKEKYIFLLEYLTGLESIYSNLYEEEKSITDQKYVKMTLPILEEALAYAQSDIMKNYQYEANHLNKKTYRDTDDYSYYLISEPHILSTIIVLYFSKLENFEQAVKYCNRLITITSPENPKIIIRYQVRAIFKRKLDDSKGAEQDDIKAQYFNAKHDAP